jgi:dynein heavy chain
MKPFVNQTKKPNKRASNRQKLKALEWTDDAIEDCNNAGAQFFVDIDGNRLDEKYVNTMEAKIARVQQRKKEAEVRAEKRKKQQFKESMPGVSFPVQKMSNSKDLKTQSALLNSFFSEVFASYPDLNNEWVANFPLYMYDSSEFDEMLKFDLSEQCFGICFFPDPPQSNSLGLFQPCKLLDMSSDHLKIEAFGQVSDDCPSVSRLQVYQVGQNLECYSKRIVAAFVKRAQCVSLMRYYNYVQNMPMNQRITSSMSTAQSERIREKAVSLNRLRALHPSIAEDQIMEAKYEFESIMNKILFDSNLLAIRNIDFFNSLKLPAEAVSKPTYYPYYGLARITQYNLRYRINFHRTGSYLGSSAAILSLQAVLKENKVVDDFEIMKLFYSKPFTLEKFDRHISEQIIVATRTIKQEWPMRSGQSVRQTIGRVQEGLEINPLPDAHTVLSATSNGMVTPSNACVVYDIALRNVYEFEKSTNPIKGLLERINFMMSDVLKSVVKASLFRFTELVEDFCSSEITVHDIKNIIVNIPEHSIYKTKVLPPFFIVAFRIGSEDKCLNLDELERNKREIATWMKTKEAENGEKCPIKIIPPVVGKTFEYSQNPVEFKDILLKAFKLIVNDFLDVPHVQKFVMDKIYFPHPKYIECYTLDQPWAAEALHRCEIALDKALAPLITYLKFFKKYENFVNIDNDVYINSRIPITKKDPDSCEIELPVSVNLQQVYALIDEHLSNIQEIEESLPLQPIECGLFLVDVVSVRNLLLDKHRAIIRAILTYQSDRCNVVSIYLEEEFKKINKSLSKRPENIEQLVEQEEYISSLGTTISLLQSCISEMMNYFELLEKYKFKIDMDSGTLRWTIFGFPAKIAAKCAEVQENNLAVKRRFRDEMLGEQASFIKVLHELDHSVKSLESLNDLNDVVNNAIKVKEVETRIQVATTKVKLFNSRETLFEQDITDYEELNRIQRNFEPYLNLWQTAKEWIELSQQWKRGRFTDLNADEVEKNVDKYNIAITKAAKFFTKADMKIQSTIANKIKTQVSEFLPEVPMIVTLRNPGMRDRHWQKISEQLHVEIMPVENFTTEQIIAMNLKDSLELIQKISESAAKEYQIEQALDKMEREWENMNLNIHNYRETGTGVLKGVDDINVVLDEQITMTQVYFVVILPVFYFLIECHRLLCFLHLKALLKDELKSGTGSSAPSLMYWKSG